MTSRAFDVIHLLSGKTLATAESCTGGGIGAVLTSVSGSSAVFKGGIISYCNEIKHKLLGVSMLDLEKYGAVSAPVAKQMALGACRALEADIAVSVTGLAGPGGDDFGHSVGTVFIGYGENGKADCREFHFIGGREKVRNQAIEAALQFILDKQKPNC